MQADRQHGAYANSNLGDPDKGLANSWITSEQRAVLLDEKSTPEEIEKVVNEVRAQLSMNGMVMLALHVSIGSECHTRNVPVWH